MRTKKVLKSIADKEVKPLYLKLKKNEFELIKKKAVLYADGNVSEFIRYAALNFEPTDKDLA